MTELEGRKDDGGKMRLDLIPPELMFDVASVLTYGAAKYTIEVINEWDALLHAQCATELRVYTPKGNVVVVTRDSYGNPIQSMQNASVRTEGIGRRGTKTKCVSWQNVDSLIQSLVRETTQQNDVTRLQSMGLQSTSIKVCAPKVVSFAQPPNTCMLIIVTKLGNLEVSFAPGATMDSAFWATVWKDLSEHFGISKPQKMTGERNWERGMGWGRVFGAAMRHLWAWWAGEDKDPETGLSHLAHALCCVMFLATYERRGVGHDDRPAKTN